MHFVHITKLFYLNAFSLKCFFTQKKSNDLLFKCVGSLR